SDIANRTAPPTSAVFSTPRQRAALGDAIRAATSGSPSAAPPPQDKLPSEKRVHAGHCSDRLGSEQDEDQLPIPGTKRLIPRAECGRATESLREPQRRLRTSLSSVLTWFGSLSMTRPPA